MKAFQISSVVYYTVFIKEIQKLGQSITAISYYNNSFVHLNNATKKKAPIVLAFKDFLTHMVAKIITLVHSV